MPRYRRKTMKKLTIRDLQDNLVEMLCAVRMYHEDIARMYMAEGASPDEATKNAWADEAPSAAIAAIEAMKTLK
jgi:hypothetical protein